MSLSPEDKKIAKHLCKSYTRFLETRFVHDSRWDSEAEMKNQLGRVEFLRNGFCNVKTKNEFDDLIWEADQTN